jgi:hypothetical protein
MERKRGADLGSERQSVRKWHGSEMAFREIEHLSIFSNANQ